MVKPRMRSSSSPTRTFMKPCLSPVACARSTESTGSLATRTITPWRSASPLLSPTWASGGHAIGDQPVARAAIAPRQVVTNDPKVILRHVRECRAAGAFAKRPNARDSRLQALVDADVTARGQFYAGLLDADVGSIRNASRRDENVAAFDILLARSGAGEKADLLARSAANVQKLGGHVNLNAL